MDNIFKTLVTFTLLLSLVYGTYDITKTMHETEPKSDLFWIDNTRVHKDSTIQCTDIYGSDNEKVGEYIIVKHNETVMYIECLDTNDYTWQDFRDSWLMAFREGTNDIK